MKKSRLNYPDCWDAYCTFIKSKATTKMPVEFRHKGDNMNRFAARFRLAKSFCALDLESFSKKTAEGYASIFKVFLAFTVYEFYVKEILGVNLNSFSKNYKNKLISTFDLHYVLHFLQDHLNKQSEELKKRIDPKFAKIEVIDLARAIRHIFAHGFLTFNIDNAVPRHTKQACKKIANTILEIVNKDFCARIGK